MSSGFKPAQKSVAPTWVVVATGLLGLLTVGASALHLSAYGLARYLNSDFLTPYFFCSDLLTGRYPLSGWTLSASPYFVPDHLMLGGLLAALGRSGLAYALYTPVFYLALFLLAGLCVKTVVGRTGPALLAGLWFGGGLLSLRALPGHTLWLWWLGAPCCHGGALLLGFAYLWTLGTGIRRERVGRLPGGLFCLGLLGMLSDTLFLLQILLPAGVALFACRRRHPGFARWRRWQGGCAVGAVICAQLFKPICRGCDWFYFSRILRVAPTPLNQWHALRQFLADLPHLLHDGWGFALLVLLAAWVAGRSLRAWRHDVPGGSPPGESHGGVLDFFRIFCVVSLLLMFPLPILTCAWKSPNNVRYLFNWLVLPGFLLALEAAAKWETSASTLPDWRHRRWGPAGVAIVLLVGLVCAINGLAREPLRFPYPDDVAALDVVLQRHGLKHGLAQYWDAKYVTALSHAGAELRQVRANGEPYFWDNNAFGYYERDAAGEFSWPAYQYILTDLLDERAVAQAFGEPQAKENAGRFRVWIYAETGQGRIRDALEHVVREKLGPKRLARWPQGFVVPQ